MIVRIYFKVKLKDFASVLFSSLILIFVIIFTLLYIYLIKNSEYKINVDIWINIMMLAFTFLYIYPFYLLIKSNKYFKKYINIIFITLYSTLFIVIIIIPWINIIRNE